MKITRRSNKGLNLFADGESEVGKIQCDKISIRVINDKGLYQNQDIKVTFTLEEAYEVSKKIIKQVIKHKIKQLFRRERNESKNIK